MVTFAFVGSDGHEALNGLMRSSRAGVFDLLKARFKKALEEGELSLPSDVAKLARFVQTVQCGMAIRARDGADTAELQDVADIAMAGWDSVVGRPA